MRRCVLNPLRARKRTLTHRKRFACRKVYGFEVYATVECVRCDVFDVRKNTSVRRTLVDEAVIHFADDDCLVVGVVVSAAFFDHRRAAKCVFADVCEFRVCAHLDFCKVFEICKRAVFDFLHVVAESNCFKCDSVCKRTVRNRRNRLKLSVECVGVGYVRRIVIGRNVKRLDDVRSDARRFAVGILLTDKLV